MPEIQLQRTRLDAALIAVALLPLLAVAAIIAYDYQRTGAEVDAAIESKLDVLHGHVAKVLEINALLLDRMAERFDGLTIAQIRAEEREHHSRLARLHEMHRDVLGLSIIGADGRGAAHSQLFPIPAANAADRDYFGVHRDTPATGVYISERLHSRIANEPGFVMSRRRGPPGAAFDGIYNASIRAYYLLDFWTESLQHGEDEFTSLVRSDGAILARLPLLPPDAPLRLQAEEPLVRLMQSGAKDGRMEATSRIDGKRRIVAARRVDPFPVYIAYGLTRERAFAGWRREAIVFGAVALAMTAVLLGLALLNLRRTREMAQADRRKDEFLAALAHELRNPLGAIANGSALLEKSPDVEKSARIAVPIIGRQVRQLQRLVDDLLDTARSVHGKLILERSPLELRELAAAAVAAQRERAGDVRFELAGEPAWVDGDAARLTQVFDNLLDNAVKYGARRVSVALRAEPGWVEAAVQDDGEGISGELLPQLFQPFTQGPQTLARPRGGLGLGLALVRRLVEAHGGTVSAASKGPGRGTLFRVRLPTIPAPAAGAAQPGIEKHAPAAPRRVLVIEDQEDARESLRVLLERDGHAVRVAATGDQGLALLAREAPDVALVDIGLAGIDGYEVARRARRAANGGRRVLLVALTGYGQDTDRQRAVEAGFDLHLTKPVSYESLQQALSESEREAQDRRSVW